MDKTVSISGIDQFLIDNANVKTETIPYPSPECTHVCLTPDERKQIDILGKTLIDQHHFGKPLL